MKNESAYKTAFIKAINKAGGYGRRIEDQYAVGVLDMVVVIPRYPVFFIEGKLADGNFIEPRVRQGIEMRRIEAAGGVSLLMGFEPDRIHIARVTERVALTDSRVMHFLTAAFHPREMLEHYWRLTNG